MTRSLKLFCNESHSEYAPGKRSLASTKSCNACSYSVCSNLRQIIIPLHEYKFDIVSAIQSCGECLRRLITPNDNSAVLQR